MHPLNLAPRRRVSSASAALPGHLAPAGHPGPAASVPPPLPSQTVRDATWQGAPARTHPRHQSRSPSRSRRAVGVGPGPQRRTCAAAKRSLRWHGANEATTKYLIRHTKKLSSCPVLVECNERRIQPPTKGTTRKKHDKTASPAVLSCPVSSNVMNGLTQDLILCTSQVPPSRDLGSVTCP